MFVCLLIFLVMSHICDSLEICVIFMVVLFYDFLNIFIFARLWFALAVYILVVVLHPDDLTLEKFKSECGETLKKYSKNNRKTWLEWELFFAIFSFQDPIYQVGWACKTGKPVNGEKLQLYRRSTDLWVYHYILEKG